MRLVKKRRHQRLQTACYDSMYDTRYVHNTPLLHKYGTISTIPKEDPKKNPTKNIDHRKES